MRPRRCRKVHGPARITEYAGAIMAGTPAELERIAQEIGRLPW